MSANSRPTARSPGRTPPFILVGLVVLVGFLGYSYWSLSSANASLKRELETIEVSRREADQKRSDVEETLVKAREALQQAQSKLDESEKLVQDKEAEINNIKTDLSNKQSDTENLQKSIATCDENLEVQTKELDKVRGEKNELEKQLQDENQKDHTCDMGKCIEPVRQVLTAVSKSIGSDAVAKSLADSQIDASTLMEGIQFPAPVNQQTANQQQQPAAAANVQPNQQPVQEQQGQVQDTAALVAQTGVKTDVNNNGGNIKEMKIGGDNPSIPTQEKVATNETLVFQSDTNTKKEETDAKKQMATEQDKKENLVDLGKKQMEDNIQEEKNQKEDSIQEGKNQQEEEKEKMELKEEEEYRELTTTIRSEMSSLEKENEEVEEEVEEVENVDDGQ